MLTEEIAENYIKPKRYKVNESTNEKTYKKIGLFSEKSIRPKEEAVFLIGYYRITVDYDPLPLYEAVYKNDLVKIKELTSGKREKMIYVATSFERGFSIMCIAILIHNFDLIIPLIRIGFEQ